MARYASAGVFAAYIGLACTSGAQTSEEVKIGTAPELGVSALSGEVTASQYIKEPGAPYENTFKNLDLGLSTGPKVGAARTRVGLGPVALGPGLSTPISRGFKPEDAELKIGPFFLNFTEVTGSVLYSDNVRRTEQNRDADATAAISLGTEALFQINDGLQFAVRGRLVYLPFENRFGVDGFGISDPFAQLSLDGTTLFRAQMTYEFTLGGWDVLLFDDFRIQNQSLYRLGEGDFLDTYDGETFQSERTFAGRPDVYRPGVYAPPGFRDDLNNNDRFDASEILYVNAAGGRMSRVLPTVTRATLQYVHENVWYPNASRGSIPFIDYSRDIFTARLDSERENLRFKPFAQYEAAKYSYRPGWEHETIAGLKGPITDQLDFLGYGGYRFYTGNNSARSSTIWVLSLTHDAGPYTRHSTAYYREVTEPQRFLRETYNYQIAQILGPYMVGGFYFSRDKYGDLDSKSTFVEETVLAGFLYYDFGKRGNLNLQSYYTMTDYTNPATPDGDRWTLRVLYNLDFTPDMRGTLLYQFENKNSEATGFSYYENLLGVTVTKAF